MTKIEKEQLVIADMIKLYCCKKHPVEHFSELCPECAQLLEYAQSRLARCPHGNAKPSCRSCRIHCYQPAHRQRIAAVMRYSGPRMLLYHPLTALRHLFFH